MATPGIAATLSNRSQAGPARELSPGLVCAAYTRDVPKTLLTGGAGLVGGHVVRLLAERGDDLRLTVRETSRLDNIADIEYEPAVCDILDRRAVRRAMRNVDRVYHVAGSTSLRASAEHLHRTNVQRTRVVLEEALRAARQPVAYTPSRA